MKKHSLFTTLQNLKGNPRGCVYTEPLWGIPFNLYVPYVSVYMLALGVSKEQIGLIASIPACHALEITALCSAAIPDTVAAGADERPQFLCRTKAAQRL